MVSGFLKLLNLLALVALLLSGASVVIPPTAMWSLSFFGFAFPVILIVNLLFLLLWVLRFDKFLLLPLLSLVVSWPLIHSVFALNFQDKNNEEGIRLMTWNVKNFDLYNWSHNTETREEMMALIKNQNPDILCLQEFYTNNQLFFNREYLRDSLGYTYSHFPSTVDLVKHPKGKLQQTLWKSGELHQQWGVAIFSKFPISDTGSIDFANSLTNGCIYSDLMINGKKLRVYNVHFQSMHLGYNDYATLDSLQTNQNSGWLPVKNIIRKMKRAYAKRAIQANEVAKSAATYQGRKIICGDFNDVPVSYTYHTVKGDFKDAFIEKETGLGATFVNKVSIFRIDYTLFDKQFKINSYKTIRNGLSDHYPLLVTFNI